MKFKWTVEFEVDEIWVADGFDLDAERAEAMLMNDLTFAEGHEVSAKVIAAPSRERIREAQGYAPSIEHGTLAANRQYPDLDPSNQRRRQ